MAQTPMHQPRRAVVTTAAATVAAKLQQFEMIVTAAAVVVVLLVCSCMCGVVELLDDDEAVEINDDVVLHCSTVNVTPWVQKIDLTWTTVATNVMLPAVVDCAVQTNVTDDLSTLLL
jgi:hypothetical protein